MSKTKLELGRIEIGTNPDSGTERLFQFTKKAVAVAHEILLDEIESLRHEIERLQADIDALKTDQAWITHGAGGCCGKCK